MIRPRFFTMDTIQRFIIASLALHGVILAAVSSYDSMTARRHRVQTANWVVDVITDIRSEQAGPDNSAAVQDQEVLPSQDEPQSQPPPESAAPAELPPDAPPAPVPPASQADPSVGSTGTGGQASAPVNTVALTGAFLSQGFRNTMNAQAIVAQLGNYRRVSGLALKGMVSQALPAEERQRPDEVRGTVLVTFQDGAVASLSVESEDEQFRSLLRDRIDWSLLPAPRQFSLPISRVACTVSVSNGKIRVGVGPI
ncbi:hypothetical protein GeomeDRAFT_3242 [Geobacter metallireducens RCH3]|uniref:Uncharacterized protein n=1 Tax=Geobacter metallireducens (strain ATCC 53774 / DSM 7210 / GS-15) TaxID=269799 RepID=Q39XR5_GEOMG|nr:hypothetical protein [Geobacter metallireducens]ABB30959.1 hypothetical protein Gmet_0717 [Geobacter metallireducens GS-15]EHP84137.1 hypothetical protein GeomeDRAFT_3242 [Geobacter metallireducens RCH3]